MSTASLRVVGHECHTPLQIKKFYISTDGTHTYTHTYAHTHTRPAAAGQMMKGKWKWDDNDIEIPGSCCRLSHENEMTATYRDARRGTQEKNEKRESTNKNTPGPSPERANPEKAREKKKRTDAGAKHRPEEGAADRSAWHNLQGESQTCLGTRRTQTWPNTGARMRKGTHGDLVNDKWCARKSRDKARGSPINGLSVQPFELVHKWTSPETKKSKKDHT